MLLLCLFICSFFARPRFPLELTRAIFGIVLACYDPTYVLDRLVKTGVESFPRDLPHSKPEEFFVHGPADTGCPFTLRTDVILYPSHSISRSSHSDTISLYTLDHLYGQMPDNAVQMLVYCGRKIICPVLVILFTTALDY